ncbi:MAG: hypothetical protein WCY70_01805 [Methanoculleus sp.]
MLLSPPFTCGFGHLGKTVKTSENRPIRRMNTEQDTFDVPE